MKKILILAFALSLSACATLSNQQLAVIESGYLASLKTFNAYKKLCKQGVADTNCRGNVTTVQPYIRDAQAAIVQARTTKSVTALGGAQTALLALQTVLVQYGVK